MSPLFRAGERLRAFVWALRAARAAGRGLAAGGLDAVSLPPVPPVPAGVAGGVDLALRLTRRTCLVRSSVRQAWQAAHGRPTDLVIGVTAPGASFRAHAWLASDPPQAGAGFVELTRRPAPPPA